MAVTIGSVTLDNDMVWIDKNAYPDLIASVETSLSGKRITMESSRGAHFPITLEATNKYGILTGATVDALRGYSATKGGAYVLSLGGVNYTVRFRNEVGGGAIQMTPLYPTSAPDDDTLYIGKIYLECVG